MWEGCKHSLQLWTTIFKKIIFVQKKKTGAKSSRMLITLFLPECFGGAWAARARETSGDLQGKGSPWNVFWSARKIDEKPSFWYSNWWQNFLSQEPWWKPLWLLLVANFRLCYHCGNLAGPEGGCLVAISLNAPSPLLGLCRLSKFSLAANG